MHPRSTRQFPLALLLWLGPAVACPGRAEAQALNAGVVAGVLNYDLGGSEEYFTYGLQLRYSITPILQLGLLGSTAHIGAPSRLFAGPGTDERLWRAAASAALVTQPARGLVVGARGMLGVVHSAGVVYRGPPEELEPTWTFADEPTGLTYGGGLMAELGLASAVRALVQGTIWASRIYGATGVDAELLFGVGLDL